MGAILNCGSVRSRGGRCSAAAPHPRCPGRYKPGIVDIDRRLCVLRVSL